MTRLIHIPSLEEVEIEYSKLIFRRAKVYAVENDKRELLGEIKDAPLPQRQRLHILSKMKKDLVIQSEYNIKGGDSELYVCDTEYLKYNIPEIGQIYGTKFRGIDLELLCIESNNDGHFSFKVLNAPYNVLTLSLYDSLELRKIKRYKLHGWANDLDKLGSSNLPKGIIHLSELTDLMLQGEYQFMITNTENDDGVTIVFVEENNRRFTQR